MKKIIGCLSLCVLCAPYSAGWGLQIGSNDEHSFLFQHLGQAQVEQEVCVRTYADGESFAGLPQDSRVSQEKLVEELEKGFNYWFSKSREFLQKSGRSAEFADVLAVLPQQVTLKLAPECSAGKSLQLVYSPRNWYINVRREEGKPVSVTHKTHYSVPAERISKDIAYTENYPTGSVITLYERLDLINLPQVLTHEVGHILGLADQYGFAPYLTPGENTSSNFAYFKVTGKNTQRLNSSLHLRKPASLMGAPYYHAKALNTMWADDVDGLINAIDYVQVYRRGLLSPRVVNGWKSFSLADKKVGYALGIPFQYTAQFALPDELLAAVSSYTNGVVAGVPVQDIASLQDWYQQTSALAVYQQVNWKEVQDWQTARLVRQETQQALAQIAEPVATEQFAISAIQALPVSVAGQSVIADIPEPKPLNLLSSSQLPAVSSVRNPLDDDPDCQFYLIITDKELGWFYKQYGPKLKIARRKMKAQQKLSDRETHLLRWHAQMKENQRKTAKCQMEHLD